jgi:CheY-like chemotaxis protein
MISGRPAKILLIDSNVYFAKRLSDALKKEGFEVLSSTQPAFALTTLEYDAPTAVVCATSMREMGALEIAQIIHADPKNANLPIIALGDGSQRALLEAFQAGCEDYIDRQRPPAVIATHIRNIVISKAEGFHPTQMLPQADTSLSGSLTHHDLPGVLQMLGHAHQTGALHINAGATDALLFFDAGNIVHAECGPLFGDEAVIHIIKSCVQGAGVYKFVYGTATSQHTVLRSATDLMLDAMREYDETSRDSAGEDSAALSALGALDPEISAPETSAPETSEPAVDAPPDSAERFSTTRVATTPTEGFNVSDRVLADLRSRPESPVDRALADLISSGHITSDTDHEDHADPAPVTAEPDADQHSSGQLSQDSSADEHETADHTTDKELP